MRTTIDLPDELLIAAKKKAAERREPLRALFERGLRRELQDAGRPKRRARKPIHWVTSDGGLPPGLDLTDRDKMYDWLWKHR